LSASTPIIVSAQFGPGDDGWLQQLRRSRYPTDRNRVPAHLTLFYHLPPSAEGELDRRLAAATAAPPPPAMLTGVLDLGPLTAFRVESEALVAIREELAEAFHGMLAAQDQVVWRPHITIQNKVEPRVAEALRRELAATFEPRPLAIRALASWRYTDAGWDLIKSRPFRL
jgi:hypothetical protein